MAFSLIILAISLSLDALSVGVIYGFRQVKIPLIPKLIICMFSILYAGLALIFGHFLASTISPRNGKWIGISILLFMGIWIVVQGWLKNRGQSESNDDTLAPEPTLFKMVINSLGITIQIIRNPIEFDLDKSGTIDNFEAFLLGFGLSLDAIGVGIGSALVGMSSVAIPFLIGFFQFVFLYVGGFCGEKFVACLPLNKKWLSIIPGFLLIVMALIRI